MKTARRHENGGLTRFAEALGCRALACGLLLGATSTLALPNLTPYQPSGWSDKIVVARTASSTTDSTSLLNTDWLYVSWAVGNNGTTTAVETFYLYLYVDGVYKTSWYSSQLSAGDYVYVTGYSLGTLASGTHTIEVRADPTYAIYESYENDNSYTKTITVGGGLPDLTPYQPAGWSDKIVVSRTTGTTTDDSNLTADDTLYVDWALINAGAGTSPGFATSCSVDDIERASSAVWYSIEAGAHHYEQDFSIGCLSAGTHTISVTADANHSVAESNEGNNSYVKTITVGGGQPLVLSVVPGVPARLRMHGPAGRTLVILAADRLGPNSLWSAVGTTNPPAMPCTLDLPLPATSQQFMRVVMTDNNRPPVLNAIGPKAVLAGQTLTFTATAQDPDTSQTLTFSLDPGVPGGASINPTTGLFSWTPASTGVFSITVRVTDNGNPSFSDSEIIAVTVNTPNRPPVLAAIGNKTVNEGAALTFKATATDPDAGQTLTYSLGAGAPTGATINSSTGDFAWTPSEAQGPGNYPVTIVVTDNGTPPGSDSETITVTVNEVNQAPVLATIGNKAVPVNSPLAFTAAATDGDIPAQTLSFSLGSGAPAGATIHPSTGVFTWTPTAINSYSITVKVQDNANPPLIDSETFTVSVVAVSNTTLTARVDVGRLAGLFDGRNVPLDTRLRQVSVHRLDGTLIAAETNAANLASAALTTLSFTNSNTINIPSLGAATPYPSTLSVAGVTGTVYSVQTSLRQVLHLVPDDLDILLVSPAGKKVMLMSDAGGTNALTDSLINFDDAAASALPDEDAIALEGTYLPANYAPQDTLPAPAPAGPYDTTLASLAGTNPNGGWSLYVYDDSADLSEIALVYEWDVSLTVGSGTGVTLIVPTGAAYLLRAETMDGTVLWAVTPTISQPTNQIISLRSSCEATLLYASLGSVPSSGGLQNEVLAKAQQAFRLDEDRLVRTVRRIVENVVMKKVGYTPLTETSLERLRAFAGGMSPRRSLDAILDSPQTDLVPYVYCRRIVHPMLPSNVLMSELKNERWDYRLKGATSHEGGPHAVHDGSMLIFDSDRDAGSCGYPTLSLYTIPLTASAETAPTRLTIGALACENNQDPAWSWDEQKIAFISGPSPYSTNYGTRPYQVLVMNKDGSGVTQLTHDTTPSVINTRPKWSPDNQKIIYASNRTGDSEVWLMNADGSGNVNLSQSPGSADYAPAFSPDGRDIVFVSTRTEGVDLVFTDDASGMLTSTGSLASGTYKPTNYGSAADTFAAPAPAGPYASTMSVFKGQNPNGTWSLYVVDDGSGDAGTIQGGWSLAIGTSIGGQGRYANATAITIPSSGTATPYPSTVSVAGLSGTITRVSITLSNLVHSWPGDLDILLTSPTGQKVLVLSDAAASYHIYNEIYVMNVDGGNVRRLTQNLVREDSPSWAHNGLELLIVRGNAADSAGTLFGISAITGEVAYEFGDFAAATVYDRPVLAAGQLVLLPVKRVIDLGQYTTEGYVTTEGGALRTGNTPDVGTAYQPYPRPTDVFSENHHEIYQACPNYSPSPSNWGLGGGDYYYGGY